jgi:replication factor A2
MRGQGKDRISLVPVSIKQLHSITTQGDSNYMLDDKEVFNVKVVASVVDVEAHTTHMLVKINDGTGTFNCKHWTDASSGDSKPTYQ